MLLLHGLGCSSAYFRPLYPYLAQRFTLHVPDLPGHGRSAKPRDRMWRLCELTDWVADFIRTCHIDCSIVVGHSLGGGVAVDLAARYPDLVRALVLLAPTGIPEMPPILGQIPLIMADGLLEPLRLFPYILPAYVRAGPRRMLRLAIDQTRYGQRQQLQRIDTPMLVLHGSRDFLITESTIAEIQNECQLARTRTIDRAAHALHFSHTQEVTRAMIDFVQSLPQPRTFH